MRADCQDEGEDKAKSSLAVHCRDSSRDVIKKERETEVQFLDVTCREVKREHRGY